MVKYNTITKKKANGSHAGFDVALHGVAAARIEEDGTLYVGYLKNPLKKGTLLERAMAMAAEVGDIRIIQSKDVLWLTFLQAQFSAIEAMQAYENNGNKRVDPNDLMAINIVVGAIYAQIDEESQSRKIVLPFEWKGNLKKSVTRNRVDDMISKGELKIGKTLKLSDIPEARKEDAYDAIGLALYSRETQGKIQ
jgi:hypothetical protein